MPLPKARVASTDNSFNLQKPVQKPQIAVDKTEASKQDVTVRDGATDASSTPEVQEKSATGLSLKERLAKNLKGGRAKTTVSALLNGEIPTAQSESNNPEKGNEAVEEESENQYPSSIGEEEFTKEAFHQCWQDYADKLKDLGKPIVSSILVRLEPEIAEGGELKLVFENKTQFERFEEEQKSLLEYLRSNLNNAAIFFSTEIIEGSGPKVIISLQERYDHMVEKNPAIAKLKSTFNMSVE